MILADVVEQHAEEAAHLWSIRDRAALAPGWNAEKLAGLDERIEAHLDGLRLAGAEGWEILRDTLPLGEAGELFAAGALAFGALKPEWVEPVVEAAAADPLLGRGLVSAVGWLDGRAAAKPLRLLLAGDDPAILVLGLRAAAIRRVDPGPALATALQGDHPGLRAAAQRSVGELAASIHLPAVLAALEHPDPACAFWAAWTGAVLGGDPVAVDTLAAAIEGPSWERAIPAALWRLDAARAAAWPGELMSAPETAAQGVRAAGLWGDPLWIPRLIEFMEDPAFSRAALEAFVWITGVDVVQARLRGEPVSPAPDEGNDDEFPPEDRDAGLDFPNPRAVGDWWESHRSRFPAGRRFLLGRPWSTEALDQALAVASQRHRAGLAVARAVHFPGSPLPEIRRRVG